MKIKKSELPPGWYPRSRDAVLAQLEEWNKNTGPVSGKKALACIAPHAGWSYSGELAWLSWQSLIDAETVVIIGGHRPAGSPFVIAGEYAYESPFGPVKADIQLASWLATRLDTVDERWMDNTVEVHIPMHAARFPESKALWMRAPNSMAAMELGNALAEYHGSTGRRIAVMASTDLCHYGPNYEWSPAEGGEAGRDWAKKADKRIVDAFLKMDMSQALSLANTERSACSVGAVIAAMAWARSLGVREGKLLGLSSSYEKMESDSFVGYCSIAYSR